MTTDFLSMRRIILPIRVGIDPMEGLLIANFKGDPEFEGLEPQVFDDPINGRGMRVLRYRKDGKVDVYWQPGVHVDRSTFAVGKGIGDFMETTMEPAHLKITERGVDLHVGFTDAQGCRVEFRVHEDSSGKQGFPLLAPVGFPNLPDLSNCASAAGKWSIRITGVLITGGSYLVSHEDDRATVELDVTEQWKPSGLPMSMELFTRIIRMFRTWPTTYRWSGVVEIGVAPVMSGAWERKGR
ncbi:MAG: hypothetical protein Q8M95_08870 [Candidatus Methanoperedens sp.]|nr:hypothetical protein [Candidatus Methanoperedens sp.]